VASCASKPESTASSILCVVSAFIVLTVSRGAPIKSHFASELGTFQNRDRIPTLRNDHDAESSVPSMMQLLGFLSILLLGLTLTTPAAHALAQQVGREQDIVDLRLGQRIQVDDGTCPAGQIKEVSGAKMTPTGVARARKCVPRVGPKTR